MSIDILQSAILPNYTDIQYKGYVLTDNQATALAEYFSAYSAYNLNKSSENLIALGNKANILASLISDNTALLQAQSNYQTALNAYNATPNPETQTALNTARDNLIKVTQSSKFLITGINAIKNTIKLYLMSSSGDYGTDYTKGGPLVRFIGKAMDESHRLDLETSIKNAITQALTPAQASLVPTQIKVTGDYEKKMWICYVGFTDNYNKFITALNFAIKGS